MTMLASPGMILLAVTAVLVAVVALPLMAPMSGDSYQGGMSLSGFTVTFTGPSGPAVLEVELARTPEEHATGLMNRESLPEGSGMLFIFGEDAPRSFWMYNTLIPLDMIFVNSSMDVVYVEEDAQPCVASCSCSCPSYNSGQPAMYVVEANAGFAREHGIGPGQKVSLDIG